MKQIIFSILSVVLFAQTAMAVYPVDPNHVPVLESQLDLSKLNVDEESHLYQVDFVDARVSIDQNSNKIVLKLQAAWSCPPNALCATVMPPEIVFEATLVNVESGVCGSIIYTAETDHRPVDGVLTQIVVIDNKENMCPTFAILNPTDVYLHEAWYDRVAGKEVNLYSTFVGGLLNPSPVLMK
jgi:hypothetical protein